MSTPPPSLPFLTLLEHAALGLSHALPASPVPLPLLDFPSAPVSPHKQAEFWLEYWDHMAVVHSRSPSCTHTHTHSLFLFHFCTSCESLLRKQPRGQVGEAGGAEGILEELKVSQAIFAGGLIV